MYAEASPMPFNTIVNVLYLIVSCRWLYWLHHHHKQIPFTTFLYLVPFHTLNMCYGVVQFIRIVTQDPYWAVVDKSLAFPFFTWTILASIDHIRFHDYRRWFALTFLPFYLCTVCSFRIVLAVHILATILTTIHVCQPHTTKLWCYALVCCCGFVGLKYWDHELATVYPPLFTVLSGHFWSKVCDVGQAHFISRFFLEHHRWSV
jgi:TMEM187 protein family